MASHTIEEIQQALVDHEYMTQKDDKGNDNVDGQIGPLTTAAVVKFQADKGIVPADGNINAKTLDVLFNTAPPAAPVTEKTAGGILGNLFPTFKLPDIGATIGDYALNFITSKINGVSAALALIVIAWVNNKIPLDDGTKNWITSGFMLAGTGVIFVLRTFFNKPKVASAMPLKITNTKSA